MTEAPTDTPTPTPTMTCSRCKKPCQVLFRELIYPSGVCPACQDVLYRIAEDVKVELQDLQELEDDDDGNEHTCDGI